MTEAGYEYSFGETLLEVKDLNVSYTNDEGKENKILRNVSFAIKNIKRPTKATGQVDALLAPSGTGKSQIFRAVAGLHKPNSGTITIDLDGSGTMVPVKVGMVGVVAQDYPLFNHLTLWDNIYLAAKLKNPPEKAKEITQGYLERFGLTACAHNYPHQVSGGQRQRAAIIQQMVCSGHLLLMDEPFSGLDILVKEEVQNLISEVAAQDELNSVIVTTHDIQSAIAVADTIMLLGHEKDAAGNIVPGAFIKHSYNLIEMGLTWHPNITEISAFVELEKEIKARFKEL